MRDLCPWAYRKGTGPLYRLSGGVKLLLLFALSIGVFFSRFLLAPGALLVILGAFACGIPPGDLLRGSRSVLLMGLLVAAFRGFGPGENFPRPEFNREGLAEGLLFALRLLLSFGAASLFFSVTTMGEIKKALRKPERLLRLERFSPSLGISLMLGFMPRFFERWEAANLAWDSRGGGKNLSRLGVLIPLAAEGMMEAAGETAEALEARGGLL
ncbi:MAG: energy-coupling factor transporter transmembrane protein EcfT [Treponema sp.]|jgi:biotin transport system permease protein|nr:energy-coupling factor transporter transmembrane protein EcfT [Treponema sp.]